MIGTDYIAVVTQQRFAGPSPGGPRQRGRRGRDHLLAHRRWLGAALRHRQQGSQKPALLLRADRRSDGGAQPAGRVSRRLAAVVPLLGARLRPGPSFLGVCGRCIRAGSGWQPLVVREAQGPLLPGDGHEGVSRFGRVLRGRRARTGRGSRQRADDGAARPTPTPANPAGPIILNERNLPCVSS